MNLGVHTTVGSVLSDDELEDFIGSMVSEDDMEKVKKLRFSWGDCMDTGPVMIRNLGWDKIVNNFRALDEVCFLLNRKFRGI